MKKIFFCLIAAMMVGVCGVSAQNPYPEEDDPDAFVIPVTYAGARPTLQDFINSSFAEGIEYGLGEVWGAVYDAWEKYKKNQKQDAGTKLTVDGKNGYFKYEHVYVNEETNEKSVLVAEICYWNCADGKHKLYCENVYCIYDGKAIETECVGISFYAFNSATRKMTHLHNETMGVQVKTGMEGVTSGIDDGGLYVSTNGERKYMTREEFDKWDSEFPIVTYSLPQVGKDIIATINNKPTGNEQVVLKWNGFRFE